ncbi:MAG: T9SS type A sorting domain-containing protein, partial [Ignavibacteria bacterium]|nr:T9SS type A sorting domain-containing protein [Ignavibacteria bacterium]
IDDPFFERVSYLGAFSPVLTERWDLPWAEYDPINAVYAPSTVEEYEGSPIIKPYVSISPNPTNGLVKVLFENTSPSLKVKVIDLLGNEKLLLEADNLRNTFYETTLDLNVLPNGTYFIVLEGINFKSLHKVVLVK